MAQAVQITRPLMKLCHGHRCWLMYVLFKNNYLKLTFAARAPAENTNPHNSGTGIGSAVEMETMD